MIEYKIKNESAPFCIFADGMPDGKLGLTTCYNGETVGWRLMLAPGGSVTFRNSQRESGRKISIVLLKIIIIKNSYEVCIVR